MRGKDDGAAEQRVKMMASQVKAASVAISGHQKELYNGLNKYGKSLEKVTGASRRRTKPKQAFRSDLSLIDSSQPFQGKEHLINRTIALHFIRQGDFELAERFMQESGEVISQNVIDEFSDLHSIRKSIWQRNLEPAIKWASQCHSQLEARHSTLEFDLHRLQFVKYFTEDDQGPAKALAYARTYFPAYGDKYLPDIQRMMTAFLYRDNLAESPYADLFYSKEPWVAVEESFVRELSSALGFSVECPLSIVINTGALALPTLMKMSVIMREKHTEWTSEGELPVEITLPNYYQFHSIFTCPVSKEQTTTANPPMLLPCGHVIAKESLARLSKGLAQKFKCPYCPMEVAPNLARQVIF